MAKNKVKVFGKKDLLLGIIIILCAIVLFGILKLAPHGGGNVARVQVDGELWGEYSLENNREVEINTERGINVIVIEDGQVWMKEANCPDRYCIDQGKIRQENEVIVCLPHKLTVEVTTEEDKPEFDAVVK